MSEEERSKRRVTYRKYEIVRQLTEGLQVLPFDELCFAVYTRERWPRGVDSEHPERIIPTVVGPNRAYRSSFARTCKLLQDEQRVKRWYCDITDLPLSIIARFAVYRTGVHPFLSWAAHLGDEIRAEIALRTLSGLLPGKRHGYFIEVCLACKNLQSTVNLPITIPALFIVSNVKMIADISPLAQSNIKLFVDSKEVSPRIGFFGDSLYRRVGSEIDPKHVLLRESYRPELTNEEQEYRDLGRPWITSRWKREYPGQQ